MEELKQTKEQFIATQLLQENAILKDQIYGYMYELQVSKDEVQALKDKYEPKKKETAK